MKLTFDFENGMQLSLKPENIQLLDNGINGTAAVTRTDNAIIPLLFFKQAMLATPLELMAREEKRVATAAQHENAAATVVSKEVIAPALVTPSAPVPTESQ